MAKDADAKDEPEAKGGKKKMIIIAVPLILVVLVAVYFLVLKKPSAGGALPAPKPGVAVTIDPITINLAGGHYLKFGMALQPIASAKTVDGSKALDLAITEFSGKTIADLESAAGREEAKSVLVARIKLAYLPEGKVSAAETEAADKAVSNGKATTDDQLDDTQVIKRAGALTVQSEVYDLYLTSFVIQ